MCILLAEVEEDGLTIPYWIGYDCVGGIMFREFVRLPEFEKCWVDAGLTEDDMLELEKTLCLNPESGDMVEGTGGLRKLRWALPNTGKRGGIRVVYVDFVYYEKTYLLSAYKKSVKDTLNDVEKNEIKKVIKLLADTLGRKGKQ